MPVSIEALGFDGLSVRERLELIEQIWDSLPEHVNPDEVPPWHLAEFAKRRQFPVDELAKYAGQYVAWSPDGAQIVASGPTEEAVEAKLEAAGIAPSQVVGEFSPPVDSVLL